MGWSQQIRNLEEIHRYLDGQGGRWCTVAEIKAYLESGNSGNPTTRDVVTIRRWLKEILEEQDHYFRDRIEVVVATKQQRTDLALSGSKAYLARSCAPLMQLGLSSSTGVALPAITGALPVESAWLVRLAERVLQDVIPDDYQADDGPLAEFFRAAMGTLRQHPDMQLLSRRVLYVPRGQRLYESAETAERRKDAVLEIMKAIGCRRMLAFRYRDAERETRVHPVAIIYRDPKMYLRAVREGDEQQRRTTDYLCSRMTDVVMDDARHSLVPDDFEVGPVDLSLHRTLGIQEPTVRLLLRIKEGNDNLIDDLDRYRLSPGQQPLWKNEAGEWELEIPQFTITAQFMQWLGGLWGRVEVMRPVELREYVKRRSGTK